jgi:two-component system sensor histidine kinase PilS (NtrC family)
MSSAGPNRPPGGAPEALTHAATLARVEPAWGTLSALALVRVMVTAFVLVSAMIFAAPPGARGNGPGQVLAVLAAYFAAAIAMALAAAYYRRQFLGQLILQLSVDLVMGTVLVVIGGGMRSEFVVFYLVPIAGASLILPTSAAFFTTSIAVLLLLSDSVLRGLREDQADSQLFQAGLYGAALFGLTGLLRMLALRLTRQEQLAHARGLDLRSQLEINRLVISQMEQGVIVVDALTSVRANNQAARLLLGLGSQAQLTGQRLVDLPALRSLGEQFLRWREERAEEVGWSDRTFLVAAQDGSAGTGAGYASARALRARFARPRSAQSGEFVIFLEDQNGIEERAQQLKLAAMGRLTASIAHEIRNPLAAISNAGQLLAEGAQDPLQQRLAGIVRENTGRLNRLVEDVLRVARREAPLSDEFTLGAFVSTWVEEFLRDRGLAPELVVVSGAGLPDAVKFEQSHLRQILFNLVDNAQRYCSGRPGAIELKLEPAAGGDGRVQLWILDDGAGVAAADRAAIFEPFYTTHARGTGLGLYLAREFCIANQAQLAYEVLRAPGGAERHGFVLRFARLGPGDDPAGPFLDTIPAAFDGLGTDRA